MGHLLDVADLTVDFATRKGPVHAVRGVSFTMGREKLGIVGESGSGKTVTGRSRSSRTRTRPRSPASPGPW